MFFKKVKPRHFSYTPFFYNEEKDKVAQERKIRFKKISQKSSSRTSLLWLIALFAMILYIVYMLKGM